MSLPSDISVSELCRMQEANADFTLLDVRDDDELAIASLENALHLPMDEVTGRLDELPKDGDIVVMCHSGGRSARVAAYLRYNGYASVANLAGGIDAWSREDRPERSSLLVGLGSHRAVHDSACRIMNGVKVGRSPTRL